MALSNDNILKAMLERATNPTTEDADELAVQIFCVTVRNDPNLIHTSFSLLISKIQSSNITESVRAISLLDECMAKCGSNFQDEAAKFRFLNDLIRLVSKKYQGDKTPAPIREKIMDSLLLWTTEYPHKTKIREAYDLLRKEGNDHACVVSPVIRKDNIMGADEDKFRKLVQSKNAEDLKKANLLLQSRVNQDARRMELVYRQRSELDQIQNTVLLLSQMLDSYESNQEHTGDDTDVIKELYDSCKGYLPIMERLPELIDNTNEDLIMETLDIRQRLRAVIERYKTSLPSKKNQKSVPSQRSPIKPTEAVRTSDLLSGLLTQPTKTTPNNPTESLSPLDELSQIFGKCNDTTTTIQRSLFDNMDLLEPTTVTPPTEQNEVKASNENNTPKKYDSSRLKDIDFLSEELLKENLKSSERIGSFKKEPEKVSLNELAKEKTIVKPAASPEELDADCLIASGPNTEDDTQADDDILIVHDSKHILTTEQVQLDKCDKVLETKQAPTVVHLTDIHVGLDDVDPTEQQILLLDDDIKITLNFTNNRPSPNVSVIVVSVTNQSKLPVTSFQFDASVRKPSKVRLLPATGDSMPVTKPFRPPTLINQVMLLLNPTKAAVDVTCIVGYKLGDDPDPIKESIVANKIAYVE